MPVVTRKRATRILIAAAALPLLLAMAAALISVLIVQGCSSGSGAGDVPSRAAQRDIPSSLLRIYEQVGAQYRIPWEVLAGIGKEECAQGRDPDPSCALQPGARGPGVANFAGASGPMQIGVGGAAGDEYDFLRRFLPDPALGPHDPTTAVELAALVLIKDKGAPAGKWIDAYRQSVQAYNGSGPLAAAYAARVLADAHSYQVAGAAIAMGCPGASAGLLAASGGYINPFAGEAWGLSRTDQGVDYDPLRVEPVRAIGAGTIVDIGSWGSYGPWFDYRLATGRFAGKCIYVAEHIGRILSPGTHFNAGDTLAIAYPGPDWTEWGWAKGLDTPAVTWAECGCTEMDNVNPGGRAFARFLRSLGAKTQQDPGAGTDVRGRIVLTRPRARRYDVNQRRPTAPWLRRVAVAVVAAGLVVAAEVLATLSAATPRIGGVRHRVEVVAHPALPYEGEPRLSQHSTAPPASWKAAVRFVRDDSAWSSGSLGAIPAQDATRRVIRLLDQAGRHKISATADVTASVRVAPAGAHRYVVTSTIGNFLVGRRGRQWLVISLPGD